MLSKELLDPEFLKYVVSTASTEDQRRYIPYLTQTFERGKFESDYESWIQTMFPQYASAPLADHHRALWEWVWSIKPDERPPAFVAIWPRGGGKSSTAEMACAALGARGVKKYILYVCHELGTEIYDPDRPNDGWSPVENHPTARTVEKEGYEVQIAGLSGSAITECVTPEHTYWARRIATRTTKVSNERFVDTRYGVPHWIEAQHLDWNTWIGYPIDAKVLSPSEFPKVQQRIRPTEELEDFPCDYFNDPDFWWLVGLWWGDGTLGGARSMQISFACADAHPEIVEKLAHIVEKLGKRLTVAKPRNGSKMTYQYFSDETLARWLKTWKQGRNRKQPPAWVEHLPLDFQRELIKGYVAADGNYDNRGVHLTSIHLPGLLAVRRMLMRLGITSGIVSRRSPSTATFAHGTYAVQRCYKLEIEQCSNLGFPETVRSRKHDLRETFIEDGFLWSRVKQIDPSGKRTFVPINTASETYVTAFGRSHNCRTQEQADDHVQNVAAMLEGATVEQYYPELGEKLVGKHGNSKGWRRSRVRTASGLTIDAIGLDTASRGVKLEENRPDGIWLDELDLQTDSPKIVRKMTSILTKSLLPSGSEHVAILYIQNLIHPNGIAAKLVSGEADYLRRRVLSGPIPALEDFAYEQRPDHTYAITSGTPTWTGFNVQRCEDLLNEIGPRAFREECQHDVNRVEGAFWSQAQLDAVRVDLQSVPDLVRIVIGVDPSGGDSEGNDEQGIIVGGIGTDGKAYILADLSCKLKPNGWGNRVIYAYDNYEADAILGEPNYGGQMVESTIRSVDNMRRKEMEDPSAPVKYVAINATRGKVWRAEPVAALFGDPDIPESWAQTQVHLAGSFPEMEEELRTWFEGCGWSPNRADAMWMVVTELLLGKQKKSGFFFG